MFSATTHQLSPEASSPCSRIWSSVMSRALITVSTLSFQRRPGNSSGREGAVSFGTAALPPKAQETRRHAARATAINVAFLVRGALTIRAMRSAMARFPAVMVVAVWNRAAGWRPLDTMPRRVWP